MDWMLLPYRRYFDFSGRSQRKEYWMFALLGLIVSAVLLAMIFLDGGMQDFDLEAGMPLNPGPLFYIGVGLFAIWALGSIIPSIAVTVRRLHDRNITGWVYLGAIVVGLIPVVGVVASIALLVLMVLPGTPGPNKYGPDPKAPTAAVFN